MDAQRKTIDCNLCGSNDASVVFKAGVGQSSRVAKCNKCGLMYASPRGKLPNQDEVKDYDPGSHRPQRPKRGATPAEQHKRAYLRSWLTSFGRPP